MDSKRRALVTGGVGIPVPCVVSADAAVGVALFL